MMNDDGKKISYLKVDIEGAEIEAIPEWITSGVLESVSQIGIELHTGRTSLGLDPGDLVQKFSSIIDFVKDLYRLGFKLINHVNNECVAKTDDPNQTYYSLMEVVFYKDA